MKASAALARRLSSLISVVILLAMTAGACSGGSSATPEDRQSGTDPEGNQPGAEAEARETPAEFTSRVRWMVGKDLRVELLTLARTPSNAVLATFKLTSYEPDGVFLGPEFSGSSQQPEEVSAISVLDTRHRLRHRVLRDEGGQCLCTRRKAVHLEMRQSLKVYAYFPAPPDSVARMTVLFPYTAAFFDVPLDEVDSPAPLPRGQPTRRPSEVSAEPEVVPITSMSFDLDGSSSTSRTGRETKVRLSAKVLFDLDKASLRPSAREELREVAAQIESADPNVVRIDGYTDSTGGPRINIPLSKSRAARVETALQTMVDGDVEFSAEGHGADNPIGDNSTAEGRQKNRRVTVTFKRAATE